MSHLPTSESATRTENPFTDKGQFLAQYAPSGDEAYLLPAWLGCLSWALTNPQVLEQFEKSTGFKRNHARSPIERMIDEATGMQAEYFAAFAKWMNENIWGGV
jgi:hypothetical protein